MGTGYRHLFGPVPSRRFGRSLGVDLTPFKTCCYDCVFCQLGGTTNKTTERREYVPTESVLTELDRWLSTDGRADYITLSGSGEPTLHSRFGEILAYLRAGTDIPTVLLTNGALFDLPEVREAAAEAGVVKVSLSAWDQVSCQWVNRPHPELEFTSFFQGQRRFRRGYRGRFWVEVFLIGGMNAMPGDVGKIADLAEGLSPDRIQLNTAVRPPAEDFVVPLSDERLGALTGLFRPEAEVIAEYRGARSGNVQVNQDVVYAMLQRRPCTAKQIAEGFGMHLNEVTKYLGMLMKRRRVQAQRNGTRVYYTAAV